MILIRRNDSDSNDEKMKDTRNVEKDNLKEGNFEFVQFKGKSEAQLNLFTAK